MKKLSILIAAVFISINIFAQAPQKMSYQAVIRNASNALVSNAPVKMRISILQGSATGSSVYSELHSATTNANGLVTIEIGGGTSPVGSFGDINWGNGTYYLKSETDPSNGTNYSIVGTSQLLSVPYALYAETYKIKDKVFFYGTNQTDSVELPDNVDIYYTADGLWNRWVQLPIPKSSNSFLKGRQNTIILIVCNSSFDMRVLKNKTDLNEDILLNTGEFAMFTFDKDKWRLISSSKNIVPLNGSEGQTLTMCGGLPTWGACLPRLRTKAITYIASATDAQTGGNITYSGATAVTVRGVVWSTSPNPTISLTTKTINGLGAGDFNSNITGLIPNTTYYVRAYATSSTGTSYGDELSFKTSVGIVGITSHSCGATNVHNATIPYGTMTDQEGNSYRTVRIGNQIWMAENLRTTKYRNGTIIPNITDNTQWQSITTGAYCSYNNNTSNDCPYGKLYNWYAVVNTNQLCATGWHVPSDAEWNTLVANLDPLYNPNAQGSQSNTAGGKMKSTGILYWLSPNTDATNSSGWSGLPGGYRGNTNGSFFSIGSNGGWWSSTLDNLVASWYRSFDYDKGNVFRFGYTKSTGFSVRCVKD
jgi:uncharacterized protein (TIGR02145 family)